MTTITYLKNQIPDVDNLFVVLIFVVLPPEGNFTEYNCITWSSHSEPTVSFDMSFKNGP